MKKVIIYGAGAYAKIFFNEVERYGVIDVIAFTVDSKYLFDSSLYGLPIVPFEEIDNIYPPGDYDMVVLCGYNRMRNRKLMYEKAKSKGYKLINYISPKAILETEIKMGENNIILSNTVIGYDGIMGNNNIIKHNTYVGHEFLMKDHSIISAGCTLGGRANIQDLVFIGIGVSARGYIRYGEESLIGVGSVVVKDIEPYSKNYGNPARPHGYHVDTGVVILEN